MELEHISNRNMILLEFFKNLTQSFSTCQDLKSLLPLEPCITKSQAFAGQAGALLMVERVQLLVVDGREFRDTTPPKLTCPMKTNGCMMYFPIKIVHF